VNTELDDQQELPVCAAPLSSEPNPQSIVRVILDEPPYEICNGVVIAPTLVLTAVNCVAQRASDNEIATNVAPLCADTGAPAEDGSFLFRFSTLASPASISVQRDDGTPFDSAVASLFVSSAASACMPDIAVLRMQLALDLPMVPLRLEAADPTGEEVIVAGYDLSAASLERHQSGATVVEATSDTGTATLPPRSLSLSGEACAKPGGAVLSQSTGALIGVVQTTQRTINCRNSTVSPVAMRMEPFRQFLLETAKAAQTSLLSEVRRDGQGFIQPCLGADDDEP
jgi:hypothetical protein